MWSREILLEFWGGRHQKPRGGHSFSLYFNPEHQGPVLGDGNCLEECTTQAQEKAAVSRVCASPLHLLGFWDRGSRKLSKERAAVWDAIVLEFG